MRKRTVFRTVILAIMVFGISYTIYNTFTKDTNQLVKVGDVSPDFVLEDLDGVKHKLSDYKGKGVVLNFWATYCKPCKEEMPDLEENYNRFKSKGVEILAINNAQTTLEVENFTDKISFPILIDHSKAVFRSYNINPLPTTFFIDSEGKVKKIHLGGMSNSVIQENIELILPK
ncbi:thiol-disulfide oxidoreductase ResA [Viridibacillus arvi]|uniref:thiol-disulfide oxidoreductase ResA n=1 Tax=Viridibacillus arvi TaxID=263475 RepID=UPI003CFF4FF9